MINLNDSGFLGACGGSGRLDLATYLITIPGGSSVDDPIDAFEYHMLAAHENSHWVRFHGTTCGATLAYLKFASERLVHDFIMNLPASDREVISRRRLAGERVFDIGAELSGVSDDCRLARQMWIDLRFAYMSLFDLGAVNIDSPGWSLIDALESACVDADFWRQRLDPNVLDNARPSIKPMSDRDRVGRVRLAGKEISTRLLYECAATIDQFLAWGADLPSSSFDKFLAPRMVKAFSSEYGAPMELFYRLSNSTSKTPTRCYSRL